jgi:Sec-independent protein translocase protein TatA
MALLSDMDWLIILAVGAFLLVGKADPQLLRTVGRWYGRAMRLKQELLSEVTRAADLPSSVTDHPVSLRNTLLGLDPPTPRPSPVPIAAVRPSMAPAMASSVFPVPAPAMTWVNSVGPEQWSVAAARFPEFEGGGR